MCCVLSLTLEGALMYDYLDFSEEKDVYKACVIQAVTITLYFLVYGYCLGV